ncbi:unnamed protein product [Orchesella dallaii]|uniref:Uncharacterized protein n=1 Tax=Orchesella dallaii TaxID=48710 RepID=A0ABP1QMQ7_9HEXA
MSPFIDTMQWVVEEPTEEDSHAYLERVIEDKRQELKMNVLDSISITNPLGHEISALMNERKKYEIFAKNALDMIDSKGFLSYKPQYLAIKEKYDVVESKFAALSNKIVPLIEIRQAIELRVPETYSRDTASMSVEEMLELMSILDEDIK